MCFKIKLLYIIGSFLGGIVSSVSPCSIAILPLILAYVCGTKNNSVSDMALKLLAFSLGLSSILSVIGVLCATAGKVFGGFDIPLLIIIFASFLMVLGLQLAGIIDLQLPTIVKQIPQSNSTSRFWYPFLIGVLFAFLAAPCSSPILLGIMAMATRTSDYVLAFFMLFAFAFGQCLIVILAGIFASFLKNLQKIQKYTDLLVKFSGWIFIIFALSTWANVYMGIIYR